jgi:hypothetical protein
MVEQTPLHITQGYQIVSVKPAEPPAGTEGSDWHLYVIAQGANRIEGHRQGKLKVVTKAVEEIVAQLNERRLGKRGRVNLVPSPKKTSQK